MSETFVSHEDAKRWAIDAERQIDRGQTPTKSRIARLRTFGHLIDLHIADMKAVGRAPGRTKTATLAMLKRELGPRNIVELDRERLLEFGRQRAERGAGPVTLSMDIGAIKLVISHAAAVHGRSMGDHKLDRADVHRQRHRARSAFRTLPTELQEPLAVQLDNVARAELTLEHR